MAKRGLPTLEEALEQAGLLPVMLERRERRGLETVARNAMVKGLPIDVIHDITGLDIDTIKQLAINNE